MLLKLWSTAEYFGVRVVNTYTAAKDAWDTWCKERAAFFFFFFSSLCLSDGITWTSSYTSSSSNDLREAGIWVQSVRCVILNVQHEISPNQNLQSGHLTQRSHSLHNNLFTYIIFFFCTYFILLLLQFWSMSGIHFQSSRTGILYRSNVRLHAC